VKRAAFAVPGDLDTPTGGYAYDKRIIAELRALGWQVDVIDLGSAFPNPDAATRATALQKLQATAEGQPIVLDGLAFGVMAEEAAKLRERHPLVALVHHPLALETGLEPATAEALRVSERRALACTRAVIVTSAPTADILCRDYGVASERIAVIRPGVDVPAGAPRSQDQHANGAVNLLAVGSVTPRKGYDLLIEVLGNLKQLPWRLTIAGDTTRNEQAFARLQADIARRKLQDRIVITGAVDAGRLAELYANADVFVLASLFEGYGMVFGEAVAHGLPIVATAVGAAPEIVPADAGSLVAPGDASALRDALRHIIVDSDARNRMAQAACEASARLPRWRQSAIAFAQVLEALT
jgi:glycosyltransferase involved in cell wall biosynthesis